MWFEPAPDGDVSTVRVPVSLSAAIGLCAVVTVVIGVLPGTVGHVSETVGLLASTVTP